MTQDIHPFVADEQIEKICNLEYFSEYFNEYLKPPDTLKDIVNAELASTIIKEREAITNGQGNFRRIWTSKKNVIIEYASLNNIDISKTMNDNNDNSTPPQKEI